MSMLPEDPESTILKKLKRPRPEDTETPETRAGSAQRNRQPAADRADAGYDRSSRAGMQQLLEARGIVH